MSRAVRRHLEGDSVHAQKRVITVSSTTDARSSRASWKWAHQSFSVRWEAYAGTFATPELQTSLCNAATSYGTDRGVCRKTMLMLLSWHRHFMHDPAMAQVSSLYGRCGGVDRHGIQPREARTLRTRDSAPPPDPTDLLGDASLVR